MTCPYPCDWTHILTNSTAVMAARPSRSSSPALRIVASGCSETLDDLDLGEHDLALTLGEPHPFLDQRQTVTRAQVPPRIDVPARDRLGARPNSVDGHGARHAAAHRARDLSPIVPP